MSLVEVQPSESNLSKDSLVASRSARSASSPSIFASVVITQSIVARAGASIPAPLAIPPIFQPAAEETVASLGTVSVVIIARAASSPPPDDRLLQADSIPGNNFSESS